MSIFKQGENRTKNDDPKTRKSTVWMKQQNSARNVRRTLIGATAKKGS